MKKLNRKFFMRPTLEVARSLLGKILVVESEKGLISGEINEVEAYIGQDDPACHAANGKTPRNEIMFYKGGHAYVYFTYGMYHCLNIVTEKEDFPAAVLIRSIIPVEGKSMMIKNRKKLSQSKKIEDKNLGNGPGKLCQALGLDLKHNGVDIIDGKILYILDSGKKIKNYQSSSRIGISKGQELQWRFFYYV